MTNRLEKGDPVPAIILPLTGGRSIDLLVPGGNGLVLFFYPKDDTKGCTLEAVDFSQHKAAFDALDVSVVGISPDDMRSHDRFREKHGLSVDLACDPDGAARKAFGTWVEKNMYGRKYFGIERSTVFICGAGTVAAVWRKVRVPGHAEAVLTEVSNQIA